MSLPKVKLYVVEKFVWASSIPDALKREKQQAPHNIYLDAKWRENNTNHANF